ncbi:MAG: glucosamine-6-phosphate deaminase, partial [Kiritimatiellaeota bacterium]|nr:glucosamine-6-phosphate deaminase [Kiritimatiellota bacterium]
MKIHKTQNYDAMSREAAKIIAAQVVLKPDSVLGLATGSTPLGLYAQLADKFKNVNLDFSETRTVNLDEYQGLAPTHPQSYRFYMDENLFSKINIRPENTHLPDGLAADPAAECARYDALIRSLGGIDLQLLGIGHDGHIGFN